MKDQLNAICPYFTMFPLDFPKKVLKRVTYKNTRTLDPFCGRGTTNFASRLNGFDTVGIDSNPVAFAISSAKLVSVTPKEVAELAIKIQNSSLIKIEIPSGQFWDLAFDKTVLEDVCKYRHYLLHCKNDNIDRALRGIILGALHGPTPKFKNSYFSNQCQRTYAPKPNYAVNYWIKNNLIPRKANTVEIIKERANKYYKELLPEVNSTIFSGDSRESELFDRIDEKFDLIITSPPYYGMRSYYQDQWLRNWFLGGKSSPDYRHDTQVKHSSPDDFANDLKKVWLNCQSVANPNCKMVVRFGGINDRKADSLTIIKKSFNGTGWKISTIKKAGFSENGRRQYSHIRKTKNNHSQMEYDVWLKLTPPACSNTLKGHELKKTTKHEVANR